MYAIRSYYAVGLAKYFTDTFKSLTGNENCVLAVLNYNTGDQDFSAQLTQVKSLNPDVIFAPGNYTESALVMKQARELDTTVPLLELQGDLCAEQGNSEAAVQHYGKAIEVLLQKPVV